MVKGMSEKESITFEQQRPKFHDLEGPPFSYSATVTGLILPDNTRLMEMRGISGMALSLYRKQLGVGAKTFYVKGKWQFIPDLDTFKEMTDWTKK